MKYINIVSSALIALACPVAALADGFKYDDEPTVEVGGADGGTPWEGDTPGIDVEVGGGITTGIDEVAAAGSTVAVKTDRSASTITIIAQAQTSVPVYRIGAPAISMLKLNTGENVFNMPRGIYIIAGRKYML